jgi:NAD(P)-dependent dehydrogenase (short-subunit alcohol dehydrogenase family)
MTIQFKNKIVVVTGSTRGFGYAIAEAFLKRDATVVVTGRSAEALQSAVKSLGVSNQIHSEELDVTNEAQIYEVIERIIQKFGRIDIWINNAGYSNAAGMILDMDPQDALDMFMSNDLGVLRCTQAVMQCMLPRKQGMLVNIYGQGSFLRPASPTGLYGTTKAWLTSFTRTLAVELKDSGVQILGFSPGMMTTDMLTSPTVVGERGKEKMQKFGFVLRFLAWSPAYAAEKLVQTISNQHREFAEIQLFKPWTPLLGLIRVGWENITKTGTTPKYEMNYEPAYRFKKKSNS